MRTLKKTTLFMIMAIGFPWPAMAGGRLLVSGTLTAYGPYSCEIIEFDVDTLEAHTFASFCFLGPGYKPSYMTQCPDGLLYVAALHNLSQAPAIIQKLDPETGELQGSFTLPMYAVSAMICLPDGTLLVNENAGLPIEHFDAGGNHLGTWASGLGEVWSMRVTPDGTKVAFIAGGSPGLGQPNRIVEYDLDGNFVREVIPASSNPLRRMDSFVFASATEFVVNNRDTQCIERFDYSTTPATALAPVVCDLGKIEYTYLARHPQNGSIFGGPGPAGCIWGWDAEGNELYVHEQSGEQQPIFCWPNPAYVGDLLVLADAEGECVESDQGAAIVIDGCDTGVANQALEDGATMAGLICLCATEAKTHGGFVSCVAHLTTDWREAGLITNNERRHILNCAAQSNIP